MPGIFSSPKPPSIKIPETPPVSDVQDELKQKEQTRQLSLLKYYLGSNQTGLDILRGTAPSSTGINL